MKKNIFIAFIVSALLLFSCWTKNMDSAIPNGSMKNVAENPKNFKSNWKVDNSIQTKVSYKAIKTWKIELCNTLNSWSLIDQCKQNVIINTSVEKLDINSCNNLRWDYNISFCKNNVYLNQAVKQKNIQLCKKLNNASVIKWCEELVSKKSK